MTIDIVKLYNTTAASTPTAYDTGPEQIIQDISRNNYIAELFLAGKGKKQIVAQGPAIKDRSLLTSRTVLQYTRPGVQREFDNPQTGDEHTVHWAFLIADLRWDSPEIKFNIDPTGRTKNGLMSMIKKVMYQKEQSLYVNMMENFDDLFFAKPDVKLMEHLDQASGGEVPQVIPINFYINENANGLYTGFSDTNGNNTTIAGINPVTRPNWKAEQLTYDAGASNVGDMSVADNLQAQLELMNRRLKFQPAPMYRQYFGKESNPRLSHVHITGETGATQWRNVQMRNNDKFRVDNIVGKSWSMEVGGVPIIEYPSLDSKEIFPNTGTNTLVTSATATKAGARYFSINVEHMWPKFYEDMMFKKGEVKEIANTDGAFRQPFHLWTQLYCNSLRRHGILSPK